MSGYTKEDFAKIFRKLPMRYVTQDEAKNEVLYSHFLTENQPSDPNEIVAVDTSPIISDAFPELKNVIAEMFCATNGDGLAEFGNNRGVSNSDRSILFFNVSDMLDLGITREELDLAHENFDKGESLNQIGFKMHGVQHEGVIAGEVRVVGV